MSGENDAVLGMHGELTDLNSELGIKEGGERKRK